VAKQSLLSAFLFALAGPNSDRDVPLVLRLSQQLMFVCCVQGHGGATWLYTSLYLRVRQVVRNKEHARHIFQ